MFSEYIAVSAGEGKYLVEASSCRLGSDINVSVVGGTLAHIGAVSLAQFEPERDSATVSTITVHTHRDDVVASFFAKAISREMKCSVTVSAGIHVDNANEDEILLLRANSAECCRKLIAALKAAKEDK